MEEPQVIGHWLLLLLGVIVSHLGTFVVVFVQRGVEFPGLGVGLDGKNIRTVAPGSMAMEGHCAAVVELVAGGCGVSCVLEKGGGQLAILSWLQITIPGLGVSRLRGRQSGVPATPRRPGFRDGWTLGRLPGAAGDAGTSTRRGWPDGGGCGLRMGAWRRGAEADARTCSSRKQTLSETVH
ncbi:hypothetical protein K474DRAFT_1370517 [Panus rudis PR-1116 ss-1]|nr:hypothetical protein K474DRAFT_1370517 [Panus rudis PR-1116 ss-1]